MQNKRNHSIEPVNPYIRKSIFLSLVLIRTCRESVYVVTLPTPLCMLHLVRSVPTDSCCMLSGGFVGCPFVSSSLGFRQLQSSFVNCNLRPDNNSRKAIRWQTSHRARCGALSPVSPDPLARYGDLTDLVCEANCCSRNRESPDGLGDLDHGEPGAIASGKRWHCHANLRPEF